MKILVALALLLFSLPALAADVTVRWVNATQFTDGSPIPSDSSGTALKQTQVQWGTCGATATTFGTATSSSIVAWPGTSTVVARPVGTHCFRLRHETNAGVFSNWTAAVQKIITSEQPNPPASVTVQ